MTPWAYDQLSDQSVLYAVETFGRGKSSTMTQHEASYLASPFLSLSLVPTVAQHSIH